MTRLYIIWFEHSRCCILFSLPVPYRPVSYLGQAQANGNRIVPERGKLQSKCEIDRKYPSTCSTSSCIGTLLTSSRCHLALTCSRHGWYSSGQQTGPYPFINITLSNYHEHYTHEKQVFCSCPREYVSLGKCEAEKILERDSNVRQWISDPTVYLDASLSSWHNSNWYVSDSVDYC